MIHMLERLFFRGHESEPDPGAEFYKDLDPEMSRSYDAALVEYGMMNEAEFNKHYPDQPFAAEEMIPSDNDSERE